MPEAVMEERTKLLVKNGDKQPVLVLRMRRDETGLKLFCKSKVIEDFFKGDSGGQMQDAGDLYGGAKAYRPVNDVPWSSDSVMKSGYGLNYGGNVNLYFLRIQGIGDGVEVHIGGVYSAEFLRRVMQEAKTAVKTVYAQYMREVEYDLEINAKEVERT